MRKAFALIAALGMVALVPFSNSILAGTTLVRDSISSEGYSAGVTGWTIKRNGNAEFNDLTARGKFISGNGTGAHIEINGTTVPNGIAFFTGDPAEISPGIIQPGISGPGVTQLDLQAPMVTGSVAPRPYLHLATANADSVAELGANSLALLSPNIYITPARQIITDEGWTALTLAGTWVQNGTAAPRIRKDISGTVHMMGRVSGGAAGLITTLPVGYRPSQLTDIALKSNNDSTSISWIQINTTGTINAVGNVAAAQVWLALNFSFSAM